MPIRPGGPQCTRIKLNGERCQLPPIKGATVCGSHGGRAPQVRAAAARRVAEAEALKQFEKYAPDRKPMDNPVEALLKLASEVDGWREFLAGKVTELEQADWRRDHRAGEQLNAMIALYERSLDRVGRLLIDLGKLDIQAKVVRLQEQEVMLLNQCLERVLERVGLAGDPQVNAIVVEELEAIAAAEEAAESDRPYTGRGQPAALPRAR